jgi:hypothetical protein
MAAAGEGVLASAARVLGERATGDARVLAAADRDGDGRISQIETIALAYGSQQLARRRAPEVFAMFDADRDGEFKRAELDIILTENPLHGATIDTRQRRVLGRQGGGAGGGISVGGAYAFFGEQQAYIQDYDVSGGTYDPVIGILGTGTVIAVSDIVITIRRSRRP